MSDKFRIPTFIILSVADCHVSLITLLFNCVSETMKSFFGNFGRTPYTGDRPIASPLPIQNSTARKHGHAFMPRAGFEPLITWSVVIKLVKCVRSGATVEDN
jgi:hypothetical protein